MPIQVFTFTWAISNRSANTHSKMGWWTYGLHSYLAMTSTAPRKGQILPARFRGPRAKRRESFSLHGPVGRKPDVRILSQSEGPGISDIEGGMRNARWRARKASGTIFARTSPRSRRVHSACGLGK